MVLLVPWLPKLCNVLRQILSSQGDVQHAIDPSGLPLYVQRPQIISAGVMRTSACRSADDSELRLIIREARHCSR